MAASKRGVLSESVRCCKRCVKSCPNCEKCFCVKVKRMATKGARIQIVYLQLLTMCSAGLFLISRTA